MNPRLGQGVNRARGMMAGFTAGQRSVVLVAVVGLVLAAVLMTRFVAQPTWTPLYGQLSGTDASAIVDQLRADNVQYQLADGGTTILVPQSQVDDLRISLAGKNLPANADGSGWSILDKQGLTATDFQQNVAYQRALEAELGKTLTAMAGVKTAVVHLALPKRDVFSTAADKPTAAVLLSLAPGTRLGRDQVRSVTHLVAGSVPNLDPNDVTVSDSTGALLSTRGLGADSAAGAAGDADAQTALYEDRMTGKLQEMLDRVLGTGNAVVKVSAQLNFDTRNTTTENYLASPSVPPLSESTTTETYAPGAAGAGGVLGVPTPSAVAGGAKGGGYAKSEGTVNRALGKQVTNEEAAPGSVQRLSVAVVLDAATTKGADVKKVMALVGNAAGIDAKRGDTVQVDQLPFDTTTAANAAKEVAAAQKQAQLDQYVGLGEKAGAVLAAVVIGLLLLKRSKAGPTVEVTAGDLPMFTQSRVEAIGAARVLPAAEPKELTAEPADPLPLERERLRDEVSSMVDNQPDDIAQLVQGWLGQQG